ncbi:MAG: hypothetical protein GY793_00230 [Proteobacteria bacterium]|nr:hypothetical protein [Pseudomonadota bacterium]
MKDKSKDKREFSDRREKESSKVNNKRAKMRRGEDRKNLKAYYVVLGINLGLLAILGIGSYLFQISN